MFHFYFVSTQMNAALRICDKFKRKPCSRATMCAPSKRPKVLYLPIIGNLSFRNLD